MVKVKKFTCSKCQASYDKRQHLYCHRLKCVKSVVYICESCRKEFNRKNTFDWHRKTCKFAKAQLLNKTCFKCGCNFERHMEQSFKFCSIIQYTGVDIEK